MIAVLSDVAAEKTQKSLVDGIEKFDATRLKHTETQEKNPLPDKDGMHLPGLSIYFCDIFTHSPFIYNARNFSLTYLCNRYSKCRYLPSSLPIRLKYCCILSYFPNVTSHCRMIKTHVVIVFVSNLYDPPDYLSYYCLPAVLTRFLFMHNERTKRACNYVPLMVKCKER